MDMLYFSLQNNEPELIYIHKCVRQRHNVAFHNTPEEFENGGFALKTHQMFSVHYAGGI